MCDYYNENSADYILSKHNKNALKAYHLNLSSFDLHKYELLASLKCMKNKFNIILLTEVGKSSAEDIQHVFKDYLIFLDPALSSRGGAAILVKKGQFKSVKISDQIRLNKKCNCSKCEIQNTWVEIETNKYKITVGCIYRHPKGNIDHFNSSFADSLKSINKKNLSIIGGDLNIDLIKFNIPTVDNYINCCLENNFIHSITVPTRITDHSATLIDHFLLKLPANLINTSTSSGVLINDISDHLPCFLAIDINCISSSERPFTRIFSQNKINNFVNSLPSEQPLLSDLNMQKIDNFISGESNEISNDLAFNQIFSQLVLNLQTLQNKYFPLIRVSKKKFKEKPYLSKGLKVSIKHKNRLYKKFLNNQNEVNEYKWRKYNKIVAKLVLKQETDYYRSILSNKDDKNRSLWKTFGSILNNKKSNKKNINHIIVNEKSITEENLITEEFNNFFVNISKDLADKFKNDQPNNTSNFKDYLGNPQAQ